MAPSETPRSSTPLPTDTPQTIRASSSALAQQAFGLPAVDGSDDWLTLFPMATRETGTPLSVVQFRARRPPVLVDGAPLTPTPLTREARRRLNEIRDRRERLNANRLQLHRAGESRPYGWAYPGTTPADPTSYRPDVTRQKDRRWYAERLIWEAFKSESQATAVNAYDAAMLTFGMGFGLGRRAEDHAFRNGLSLLLATLFRYPGIAEAFGAFGIAYHRRDRLRVLNTETGRIETGWDAAALVQATRQLLAVFISIAEDPMFAQAAIDAQWDCLLQGAARVPDYALDWPGPLIVLAAHLHRHNPRYGWHLYSRCRTVDDVLLTIGRRTGARDLSGARAFVSQGDWMDGRFRRWAGGIAWRAVMEASGGQPRHYPAEVLASPDYVDEFEDVVLFPDPARPDHYFPYWWIPLENRTILDAVYRRVRELDREEMGSLSAAISAQPLETLRSWQGAFSRRCSNDFGERVRLVLDAVVLVKGRAAAEERLALLDAAPAFLELPFSEQLLLQRALGVESADVAARLLERGRVCDCLRLIRGRSLPHLLCTFEAHEDHLPVIIGHLAGCCGGEFGEATALAAHAVARRRADEAEQRSFIDGQVAASALTTEEKGVLLAYFEARRPGVRDHQIAARLSRGAHHDLIDHLHARPMTELLHLLDIHREEIAGLADHYAACCADRVPVRFGVALQAVRIRDTSRENRIQFVRYGGVLRLAEAEQTALCDYLSLAARPLLQANDPDLAKWLAGDRQGYIAALQGRRAAHLLITLERHAAHLPDIHAYYVEHGSRRFGPAPLCAMEAVAVRWTTAGTRTRFLEENARVHALPSEARAALCAFLSLPPPECG